MVDEVDCLWSLIVLLVKFFSVVRKAISIALRSNSLHPSWKSIAELPKLAQNSKEASDGSTGSVLLSNGCLQENSSSRILPESTAKPSALRMDECPKYHRKVSLSMPTAYDAMQERLDKGLDTSSTALVGKEKMPRIVRKRPASIAIPESCVDSWLIEASKERDMIEEVEVEGSEYCLAGRKGSRHVMEDGYGVMTNINGESKQAFFGVFDGHGGRAAVDFVSEKLGKNIIMALDELVEEDQLELAIKAGYLTTDKEFLTQGVSSGACAATALLKNGELHVSNVGDCRVILSRKGVASALTRDHHAGREDERIRIENSGGFVSRRNGVWRIQDSLAVSRAFGDVNLKEWIISEPETNKVCLTPDCDFLIMASDGLWDKVSNQEAVDIVSRHKSFIQSCKELVGISYSRGSRDDITVMVVDLQRYVKSG